MIKPYFKVKIIKWTGGSFNVGLGKRETPKEDYLGSDDTSWGFNMNGYLFYDGSKIPSFSYP